MDGQEEYVRQVLEAYRKTPGTMGTVRRADRLLAAQLYQRGLSLKVIENALVLACEVVVHHPRRRRVHRGGAVRASLYRRYSKYSGLTCDASSSSITGRK